VTRTALIVTALPLEYVAAQSYLDDIHDVIHEQGTVYGVGTFVADSGPWRVVLVEAGMGNLSAGIETERAIAHFQPAVALFVGIAGGLKDVGLGDVVAASSVYAYESGKIADRFQPRGDVGVSSYRLVQRAKAEARRNRWLSLIKEPAGSPPKAVVGKLAAGEKVVANAKSDTRKMLQDLYSDALAVEMEGRGFLAATYAHPNVQSIVVRGISDLLLR
jgi:nucleoside phosphorylase